MDAVRSSCAALEAQARDVSIVSEAIGPLAVQLQQRELPPPRRADETFDSPRAEANYWCVLNMMNFGSGYRHPLHAACGRGAYETMKTGVGALHRETGNVTAAAMAAVTAEAACRYFAIPADDEELAPLVEMIVDALTDSGVRLAAAGHEDFFSLASSEATADGLVRALVALLPQFDDRRAHGELDVCLYKKAQILVADLHRILPGEFQFPDIDRLTVFSDNVLPCVLRALGVLRVSDELAALINNREHLPAGEREVELRGLAILAAERLVEAAGGSFTAAELDYWLWEQGKTPELRRLERHATRDTSYY